MTDIAKKPHILSDGNNNGIAFHGRLLSNVRDSNRRKIEYHRIVILGGLFEKSLDGGANAIWRTPLTPRHNIYATFGILRLF